MDKKKLGKQLAVIALLIVLFAGLDLAIYQLFIKRVISHHTPGMQKMSVEVANYVPFTGSGNVYSAEGAVRLEGDIPTIDGAAALLPIYAGFVAASIRKTRSSSTVKDTILPAPCIIQIPGAHTRISLTATQT